jgi:hypothetical protein
MRYEGTLRRIDLGPGTWVLVTDDAEHPLDGEIPDDLDGERVVVEGRRQGAFGFGMLGDHAIRVESLRRAGPTSN